jgi:hypothetical protein
MAFTIAPALEVIQRGRLHPSNPCKGEGSVDYLLRCRKTQFALPVGQSME